MHLAGMGSLTFNPPKVFSTGKESRYFSQVFFLFPDKCFVLIKYIYLVWDYRILIERKKFRSCFLLCVSGKTSRYLLCRHKQWETN